MDNKNNFMHNRDKKILFPLLFLPCLMIRRVLDNDVWFLLNSGRYVMEYGIPHIEPFSIHENMEFVMQQWLTDVIFWNVYNNFGENGLFIIVMICYAVIIFLMYKLTMKISEGNFFVSFILTFLSSILIYSYMVTRPTIFTLVLVMIELNVLERYVIDENYKVLYVLPFLSLLMINLHAALWIILFILMIPYIINSFKLKIGFINNEGYPKTYLFMTVVVMLIVALINPYGIDAMTYLIRSTGNPNMMNIVEIQPPYINSFSGALIFMYIFIIVLIYLFFRNGKTTVRYFLLTLGTTYMVLSSIRNITYFAICSLFPISYYIKDFVLKSKINNHKSNIYIRVILIIILAVITSTGVYTNNMKYNTYSNYFELNETIDFIYENEDIEDITLYTGFNEGSLVQFRGIPTYIDPRAEVYFKKHNKKDEIFDEYFELRFGKSYYKDILDKYNFTHLLVEKGKMLEIYLNRDVDYKMIYENQKYILFKKVNSSSSSYLNRKKYVGVSI